MPSWVTAVAIASILAALATVALAVFTSCEQITELARQTKPVAQETATDIQASSGRS